MDYYILLFILLVILLMKMDTYKIIEGHGEKNVSQLYNLIINE